MREKIQKRERMRRKFENEKERYKDRQIEQVVGSTSILCIYVIISLNDIARDNKLTSIFSLANIVHFDPNRTMQTLFKRSQHLIPLKIVVLRINLCYYRVDIRGRSRGQNCKEGYLQGTKPILGPMDIHVDVFIFIANKIMIII